jgi:hypothetical protein
MGEDLGQGGQADRSGSGTGGGLRVVVGGALDGHDDLAGSAGLGSADGLRHAFPRRRVEGPIEASAHAHPAIGRGRVAPLSRACHVRIVSKALTPARVARYLSD